MKLSLLILSALFSISVSSQSTNKLHFKSVVVDTHNDILSSAVLDGKDISHRLTVGHSDLDRWKEGGLDVQFFSVWTDKTPRRKEGFFHDAMEEIDSLDHIILRNPTRMVLATHYNEVKRGIKQNKLVCLIGVEGGHMIENDMGKLERLYERGMRYLTLTWNNSTEWATSALDETTILNQPPRGEQPVRKKGLTDFGKQIVKRMNELGIIVDLSHTGEQTFYDAIATTTRPVILSHSSVWNICPVFRNVKDEQIKAVAKNGGVICINFYSGFISKEFDELQQKLDLKKNDDYAMRLNEFNGDSIRAKAVMKTVRDSLLNAARPTLAQMVDHIDYIAKLVGVDYVGIGSDFDGVSSLPIGLDDVTTYPKITEELARRGYSKTDIRKILGENVMRVMKANLR